MCYSRSIDRVYCQPCWLFSCKNALPSRPGTSFSHQNPWGTTGLNDWGHLSQRIEVTKPPQVMRSHASYIRAMAKQQDNRRNIARVLTRKNKFLAKGLGKIIKCYFSFIHSFFVLDHHNNSKCMVTQ